MRWVICVCVHCKHISLSTRIACSHVRLQLSRKMSPVSWIDEYLKCLFDLPQGNYFFLDIPCDVLLPFSVKICTGLKILKKEWRTKLHSRRKPVKLWFYDLRFFQFSRIEAVLSRIQVNTHKITLNIYHIILMFSLNLRLIFLVLTMKNFPILSFCIQFWEFRIWGNGLCSLLAVASSQWKTTYCQLSDALVTTLRSVMQEDIFPPLWHEQVKQVCWLRDCRRLEKFLIVARKCVWYM